MASDFAAYADMALAAERYDAEHTNNVCQSCGGFGYVEIRPIAATCYMARCPDCNPEFIDKTQSNKDWITEGF